VPTARTHRSRQTLAAALLTAAVLALGLALLESADAQAALQQLAGYEKADDNRFGSLYSYLANLRDAILPLAIPVGTIGLVVVGGMYMFGSPQAGRILFGVAIGIGMVLLAPSIIA
jgi:type IV secretory pathway VirB2 component (pilin)